jgi:hypothetical protein
MRQSSLFTLNFKFKKTALSTLVVCAISASQSQAAEADQYKYTIRATAQYEGIENPNRQNDNDETEELRQGRISTQLSRQTSRVTTDLSYQFDRMDYRKDLLQDRTFTTGSGMISYMPIRDTLIWNLSHTRNMQTINAALPTTQDNLQVVKTTSTGPRLMFNLGARNQVVTSYEYARSATTFNTIYKQDRGTFDLQLKRQLTSRFTSGLGYNEFSTTSENSTLAQYDRKIMSVNNEYDSEKYQLRLDVGYIESQADLSSDYVNFDLTYAPVTDTTLNLSYANTVEDLFSNLLYAAAGAGAVVPDNGDTGTPSLSSNLAQQYKVDRAGVTLAHQVPNSMNYSLQYTTEDRVYADQGNNQNTDALGLLFSIPVGSEVTMSFVARDSDLYFQTGDRMQHRQEYGLNANWLLNRSFSLQFSLNHMKQKGNNLLDTYEGSNAMIAFTYTLSN